MGSKFRCTLSAPTDRQLMSENDSSVWRARVERRLGQCDHNSACREARLVDWASPPKSLAVVRRRREPCSITIQHDSLITTHTVGVATLCSTAHDAPMLL